MILYWVVGSFLAFFTLPATVYLPLTALRVGDNATTGLEGWTTKRARNLVVDSLRQTAEGAKFVEFTPALRTHMARNPEFRFAVFDAETRALLPGSFIDLAGYFDRESRVETRGAMIHLIDDPNPNARGYDRTIDTPIGNMRVIVYGAYFHWDDVLYQLYNYLTLTSLVAFLPLCAVMAIIALFVVRSGLAPLHSAAERVAMIDVNSMDERIARANLPMEVRPFVDAVNSALDRVREGVARQRRFAANAAHEMRTPVAILRARVERLQDDPKKHDIERDVRRIQNIVEQLLALAQLKERAMAGSEVLDLGETTLSIAADYMPVAIDNGRNIEFEGPAAPVTARADRWAVDSIVTNLIENAVRAEPEGGTITVRVGPGPTIEVVDHGEGITFEDRERIFEPFWRKHDRPSGSGLGLAIVRELLNELRGSIDVRATPGGGATFVVRLPGA
ncbi:MAG: sensor histidine kinase [Methylocystaceae bacterium]|nr:MAG: sensor histidine kinase [Methylocystaceae bacterium]